jgi:hypothetical protein
MQEYDKSSKWLIQHHGDSILRLGGLDDIAEWRPLQAEVVQPRRLPDGLIEARRRSQREPGLFVLELATYPEPRIAEQALRDMALVYLDRGIVPEVLVVVLHPRGNQQAAASAGLPSPLGWAHLQGSWRVVELWNVPADGLLKAGDVGLIPWVPLAKFDGPPEPIFRQCRARIDAEAPPGEHENLLAVAQVLAGLRYNDPRLFELLGGREAMIESPVLQKLKDEWTLEGEHKGERRAIVRILATRFGKEADELKSDLETIADAARLEELTAFATLCPDLEAFRERLVNRERQG